MENDLEMWTYRDVALRLKCCVRKIRDDYVKTGLLKAIRFGRSVRFRPCDVEALIRYLGGQQPGGAS